MIVPQLDPYSYRVTWVPPNCTQYTVDQIVERYEADPPPQQITIQDDTPCSGTTMVLVEE
jgi:hypothetical protein